MTDIEFLDRKLDILTGAVHMLLKNQSHLVDSAVSKSQLGPFKMNLIYCWTNMQAIEKMEFERK